MGTNVGCAQQNILYQVIGTVTGDVAALFET